MSITRNTPDGIHDEAHVNGRSSSNGSYSSYVKALKDYSCLRDIKDISTDRVVSCANEDEYGDAKLFADLFEGKCIYDHTSGDWYLWKGHYWQIDKVGMVYHLVAGVLSSVYYRAAAELNIRVKPVSSEEEETEENKAIKKTMKMLRGRSWYLKGIRRIKRVLEISGSFLHTTSDKWDLNQWLIGTEEGVVDLHNGFMRSGVPSDYIRTISPTKWTGIETTCPSVLKFLNDIFGDRQEGDRKELIDFVQRVLGYGITGVVRTHVFVILLGEEGRNGKDTLMTLIKETIGDLVGAISNDVLISPGRSASPGSAKPHLVSLHGKRIAWASETEKGDRFDIGQIKQLSGGGEISARQIYGKEFTFSPTHLLTLMTNNPPHADPTDNAFWERLVPIVFNIHYVNNPVRVNERKADELLLEKLMQERSGFFAWLVRGSMEWQKKGLMIPSSVLKERESYKKKENTLGMFIDDCCVIGESYSCKAIEVYNSYKDWSEQNGIKSLMSNSSFGEQLSKTYTKKRDSYGLHYYGICVRKSGVTYQEDKDPRESDVDNLVDSTTTSKDDIPYICIKCSNDEYTLDEDNNGRFRICTKCKYSEAANRK